MKTIKLFLLTGFNLLVASQPQRPFSVAEVLATIRNIQQPDQRRAVLNKLDGHRLKSSRKDNLTTSTKLATIQERPCITTV